MSKCIYCNSETTNPKFCSSSCSATYNNKLKPKRVKKKRDDCIVCGTEMTQGRKKFCSRDCQKTIPRKKKTPEEQRISNAERQSRYRQKQYRKLHPTADIELIKEFYRNRPEGCEVDHIQPLSKGGFHHQDNLQYLTKEENRRKSNKW